MKQLEVVFLLILFLYTGSMFTDKGLHLYKAGAVVVDNQYMREVSTMDCLHGEIEIDVDVIAMLASTHEKRENERGREGERKRKSSTLSPSHHCSFSHIAFVYLLKWNRQTNNIGVILCKFVFNFLPSFFSYWSNEIEN